MEEILNHVSEVIRMKVIRPAVTPTNATNTKLTKSAGNVR